MHDDQNTPGHAAVTTPEPAGPDDGLVPLVNYEARVYQLATNVPHDPDPEGMPREMRVIRLHRQETLSVLPGLNFVPLAFLRQCGFKPEDYEHKIVPQSVATLDDYQAQAVARNTTSKTALRRWLAAETRQTVRQAIQDRLTTRATQPED